MNKCAECNSHHVLASRHLALGTEIYIPLKIEDNFWCKDHLPTNYKIEPNMLMAKSDVPATGVITKVFYNE